MNRVPLPVDAATETLISIDELPVPYLEIDALGIITRVNRAAQVLHPSEQGELLGQPAFSFLASGDRTESYQSFVATMKPDAEEPSVVVRYLYDRSGKFSAYQLHRRVILDDAGNPAGMRIVGTGVSELTSAAEELSRRNQWLESVLNSLHEAIIVTDATGIITDVNTAAEELLGWKAAELEGKIVEEGLQLRSFQAGDNSHITFVMGLGGKCNGLGRLIDRHGCEVVVRIWGSPVHDKKSGSVAGIVFMLYKPGPALAVPKQ
jgi:PAS domain S-box-containing protein